VAGQVPPGDLVLALSLGDNLPHRTPQSVLPSLAVDTRLCKYRTAGRRAVIKSFSRRWLQGRPGYSPAGQATRAVYLYIAALIANALIWLICL
jgi:hypothetical protein